VQIRYQNTEADLAELTKLLPLGQRMLLWLGPLGYLALSCLPGTLLLLVVGDYFALAFGWVLVAILGLYIYVKTRRLTKPPSSKDLLPTTITIARDGFLSESDRSWARRHWCLIRKVTATGDFIALEIEHSRFFLVPTSAFASPEEAHRFATLATEFKNQAGEPQEGPDTDFVGGLEAHVSPDDQSIQVRYRNSVEDLAQISFAGLRSPGQPATSGSNPWFWPVTAIVSATLVVLLRDARPPIRRLVDVAAFALIALAMIGLFHTARRFLWMRTIDRRRLCNETVVVSPRGIESTSELAQTFNSWTAIDAIENDDQLIAVYSGKPNILHLVPTNAFRNVEDVRRFLDLARRYQQATCAHQVENSAATDLPLQETGNPYQPPRNL
jgi:hypothetical protein